MTKALKITGYLILIFYTIGGLLTIFGLPIYHKIHRINSNELFLWALGAGAIIKGIGGWYLKELKLNKALIIFLFSAIFLSAGITYDLGIEKIKLAGCLIFFTEFFLLLLLIKFINKK